MKTEALLTSHMLGPLKPRKKEYTLYDAGCPGLAIRVQPSGAMSWVTWQHNEQATRRITLDKYPDLDVAAARAARAALHAFIAGGTPTAQSGGSKDRGADPAHRLPLRRNPPAPLG